MRMDNELQNALRTLPHGPEFRFLDRLLTLVPGKTGTGEYLVRGDEPFLKGHFPGGPLFPGVLLVEAAAQLAGVVAQTDPSIEPIAKLKLTALNRVKITGTASPGEVVRLVAELTGRMGNMVQAQAAAYVGEAKVLTCEITLSGPTPET